MVQEYGPQLSQALIMNIGGEAARSDLDSLAGPLKSLVCWQPKAKTWLTDALSSEYFPSQNVGAAEKRFWLQKILRWVCPRECSSSFANSHNVFQPPGCQGNYPIDQGVLDVMSRDKSLLWLLKVWGI